MSSNRYRHWSDYDVFPGGQEFLMIAADAVGSEALHVAINWIAELRPSSKSGVGGYDQRLSAMCCTRRYHRDARLQRC